LAGVHRELIITLAERDRLPAVYCFRYFATGGGLLSYGPDTVDPFRRAAEYFSKQPKAVLARIIIRVSGGYVN